MHSLSKALFFFIFPYIENRFCFPTLHIDYSFIFLYSSQFLSTTSPTQVDSLSIPD